MSIKYLALSRLSKLNFQKSLGKQGKLKSFSALWEKKSCIFASCCSFIRWCLHRHKMWTDQGSTTEVLAAVFKNCLTGAKSWGQNIRTFNKKHLTHLGEKRFGFNKPRWYIYCWNKNIFNTNYLSFKMQK